MTLNTETEYFLDLSYLWSCQSGTVCCNFIPTKQDLDLLRFTEV